MIGILDCVYIGREDKDSDINKDWERGETYDPQLATHRDNVEDRVYQEYQRFDTSYPIERAVGYDNAEVVRELLQRGVVTEIYSEYHAKNVSLLKMAVEEDSPRVVKLLVPKEELEERKDKLLYRACLYGSVKVMEWLHSEGIELQFTQPQKGDN